MSASFTKEEMSKKLNELLGLEGKVDFTKLTKEELQTLAAALSDSKRVIRLGVQGLRKETREQILTAIEEIVGNREVSKDEGPLGLGVIPALRRKLGAKL
jgi:hypothetical protein